VYAESFASVSFNIRTKVARPLDDTGGPIEISSAAISSGSTSRRSGVAGATTGVHAVTTGSAATIHAAPRCGRPLQRSLLLALPPWGEIPA
jgi:hypothetical protein